MESAKEASIVRGIKIYGVSTLAETVDFLNGINHTVPLESRDILSSSEPMKFPYDFNEVKGNGFAWLVVVAGGHNIIIVGPPDLVNR